MSSERDMLLLWARKNGKATLKSAVLLGVDLGEPGGDKTVIVQRCPMCWRSRSFVDGMKADKWECSHADCPNRTRCTAGPSDIAPRYHP